MSKMTIANCEDFIFQLLNQYSITGGEVPLSYNDQSDTQLRMLNLINDAQMQIATTVKPINEHMEVEITEDMTEPFYEVELPEEMNNLKAVYFSPNHDDMQFMYVDARKYKMLGDDKLLLPTKVKGLYNIEYERFPETYDADTDIDTTYLDNTPDTHVVIPYYAAAMIALDENYKAYYALYNVWETRLSRLGMKPAHAVSTTVDDVYGFNHFRGVW